MININNLHPNRIKKILFKRDSLGRIDLEAPVLEAYFSPCCDIALIFNNNEKFAFAEWSRLQMISYRYY